MMMVQSEEITVYDVFRDDDAENRVVRASTNSGDLPSIRFHISRELSRRDDALHVRKVMEGVERSLEENVFTHGDLKAIVEAFGED